MPFFNYMDDSDEDQDFLNLDQLGTTARHRLGQTSPMALDSSQGYFVNPITSAPLPERGLTSEGMDALTAPKPPTLRNDRLQAYADMRAMPERRKPSVWGAIAAGLYGGAKGYLGQRPNQETIENFMSPGYRREIENWQIEANHLKRQAELERLENEAVMKGYSTELQSKIAQARIATEEARRLKEERLANKVDDGQWVSGTGGWINSKTGEIRQSPPTPSSSYMPGRGYPRIEAGQYVRDEDGKLVIDIPVPSPEKMVAPRSVPRGGRLVDPATGKVIYDDNRGPLNPSTREPRSEKEERAITVWKQNEYEQAEAAFAKDIKDIDKRFDGLKKNAKGDARKQIEKDWAQAKKDARARLQSRKQQIEKDKAQRRFVAGLQDSPDSAVQYDVSGESFGTVSPSTPPAPRSLETGAVAGAGRNPSDEAANYLKKRGIAF